MSRYTLSLIGILLLLLVTAVTAQTMPESITEAIQSELERSGVPSLQVAVGRGRELLFDGAFGFADVENDVPATTETKYRSSSISKWFTATGAMLLAEQGRLDLDASIQKYCLQFPDKRWPITTRQLLTHTSGIRHYADYESELSQATTDDERVSIRQRRSRDALGVFTRYTDVIAPLDNFKDDPLVFEPGTGWLYSSFGYRLLGCVLEGASGREYQSFLTDEILVPAGMKSTVPDDAWAIIPHRAAGYRLDKGASLRRADMRDVSENLSAGGHLTTASDLIAFAQAFQAQQLISAESAAQMMHDLSSNSEEPEDYSSWRHAIPSRDKYGYGIMSFPNESGLWIGHTGRQAGSSSIVVLIPDEDLSLAVLTNVKGWGGYLSLVRKLHSIIQQHAKPQN